jgi:tRNA U38,U39,U40 pseudouridine synthase TruA
MRAARTDKDVSALCQVVSAKLVADPAESFVERVNAALPSKVRGG